MRRKIIEIARIDSDRYEIKVDMSNGWYLANVVYDNELQSLTDSINEVRGLNQIMTLFNCDEKQALKLRRCWGEDGTSPDSDCKDCKFKRKDCYKCQFVCESPLERAMFLEFRRRGIDIVLQRRIRKDGSFYDYPEEVDVETILTVPDFYIEGKQNKVCIYADGKTYHYNNENQGIRDRTIDIALQNLGYKVVRFLGTQIRSNVKEVVDSVIQAVEGKSEICDSVEIMNNNVGYCIRCGKEIEFDANRPYCVSCWQKWNGDTDNLENYCHMCGKRKAGITFNHPIDSECKKTK